MVDPGLGPSGEKGEESGESRTIRGPKSNPGERDVVHGWVRVRLLCLDERGPGATGPVLTGDAVSVTKSDRVSGSLFYRGRMTSV